MNHQQGHKMQVFHIKSTQNKISKSITIRGLNHSADQGVRRHGNYVCPYCRNFGFNVSESKTRTCIWHKCIFPDRRVRVCICKTSYPDKHFDSTCTICNVVAPVKENQTIVNLQKLRISEIEVKFE